MRTSLILPALNEAESIGGVLAAVPRDHTHEVLVVDGGSTDGTPGIAAAYGAVVIHEPRPGYGQACATGAEAAKGELLVFMDADGADDPAQLPALTEPILHGEADLVLGSRLAGMLAQGAMPWHQRIGNQVSAGLIRVLYQQPLTDLSPFRAVLKERLLQLEMREMSYGWPTEMITKAARHGWRIREIPVTYHPRTGGKSKISGTLRGTTLATYFILSTILRYRRGG